MTRIMCECCCRWFHLKCAKEPNISDIDFKSIVFRCHLCKDYKFGDNGLSNTEKSIIERSAFSKNNFITAQYYGDNIVKSKNLIIPIIPPYLLMAKGRKCG